MWLVCKLMYGFRHYFGFILFNLAFILGCFVISVIGLLTAIVSRRACHWWVAVYGRYVNLLLRCFSGINIQIEGGAHLPINQELQETGVSKTGPYVVLSNHQSAWETFAFQYYFYPLVTILKKELLLIPFWGWALRLLHPIVLDRRQKRQALIRVIRQGRKSLEQGYHILIFPEGTRYTPPQSGNFSRSGVSLACAMGCPLLLVAHNAGLHWPAKKWVHRPGTIRMIVSKPVATAGRSVDAVYQEAVGWIEQQLAVLNQH